jgi:hypothetical protein
MEPIKAAQLRVLEAQAALAQAELDLAREARGPVITISPSRVLDASSKGLQALGRAVVDAVNNMAIQRGKTLCPSGIWEAEAARGVIFLRPSTDATPGRAIPLGETAVVLTPGRARVFLDGWPDESRIIHDAADLRDFCEGIITDPRWYRRPSSNPSTPPG